MKNTKSIGVENEREDAAGIADDEPEIRFQIYAGAIGILRENSFFFSDRTQSGYLFFTLLNDRDGIGLLNFWDPIGLLEMARNRENPT